MSQMTKAAEYHTAAATRHAATPVTAALRNALPGVGDLGATADLLFLESWELVPQDDMGLMLRVQQIRRGNPELARAIRAEVAGLRVPMG